MVDRTESRREGFVIFVRVRKLVPDASFGGVLASD